MADDYKYRAFISYSHSDEKWAQWLHRALEAYKPPKHIVGEVTAFGPIPARMAPVFRDREELATATSLGDTLTQALRDSACQIVICSPRAAKSHWTNEEILTFKRLGRSDRIFCLIVEGEPGASLKPGMEDQECFPPALIYEMGEDGELTDRRSEPIAADARRGKDNKNNAKLKLIAGMLGVGFDSLRQREHARRQRRLAILAAASIVGMTITSGLAVMAYLARLEAEEQRRIAEIEAETARQTTDFMVGLFEVSDPSEALGNTITAREILDKGAERIETDLANQPEIQATLMDTMGKVYKSLGLYEPATSLVSQALDKRITLFGRSHPDVLTSLNNLGEVQTLKADYEAAEQNLREVLAARRAFLGDTHPEVADTLTDLALVLSYQGRFADAEPLVRESLRIRRLRFGDRHEAVAESLERLGLNMYDQGELEQAARELRRAVAMLRELYGERHPDLAAAIGNLALVLTDLAEMDEAEALYREALAMQRALHGEMHPEVALALNNIAWVLSQRGALEQAEAHYREALAIQQELLGPVHPETALSLFNIAHISYERGNHADAIGMMRETLEIRREVLGAEHPDVASSALNLALWLLDAAEYPEAEALLDEGIAIRESAYGPDHPRVAVGRIAKANLLLATDRVDSALELARQAKESVMKVLPEDHWLVAYAKSAEGEALTRLKAYHAAEVLLLESQASLAQAPIAGVAEMHRARLTSLYLAWGKPGRSNR